MSQIKKFIDRINNSENRNAREVIIPINEAKELRDEIMKLLIDQSNQKKGDDEVIEVVMRGGTFK